MSTTRNKKRPKRNINIRRFFDSCPTRSIVSIINHERACGFIVSFSEAGTGFGELSFVYDKATNRFRGDLEAMHPDHVGKILERLIGSVVGGGKDE